jgi:hypothetical protein
VHNGTVNSRKWKPLGDEVQLREGARIFNGGIGEGKRKDATTNASPRHEPPPAGIISSFASRHTLTPIDTPLETIQKPKRAYLRGAGDSSISHWDFHASEESLDECCSPGKKTRKSKRKMGLSKTKRILVLLAIDSAFFLLELVVGTLQRYL